MLLCHLTFCSTWKHSNSIHFEKENFHFFAQKLEKESFFLTKSVEKISPKSTGCFQKREGMMQCVIRARCNIMLVQLYPLTSSTILLLSFANTLECKRFREIVTVLLFSLFFIPVCLFEWWYLDELDTIVYYLCSIATKSDTQCHWQMQHDCVPFLWSSPLQTAEKCRQMVAHHATRGHSSGKST